MFQGFLEKVALQGFQSLNLSFFFSKMGIITVFGASEGIKSDNHGEFLLHFLAHCEC